MDYGEYFDKSVVNDWNSVVKDIYIFKDNYKDDEEKFIEFWIKELNKFKDDLIIRLKKELYFK